MEAKSRDYDTRYLCEGHWGSGRNGDGLLATMLNLWLGAGSLAGELLSNLDLGVRKFAS